MRMFLQLLIVGLAVAQPHPNPVGCYTVDVGTYEDGATLPTIPVPETAELSSARLETPGSGVRQRYRIIPLSGGSANVYRRFSSWRMDAEGELRLTWSTGHTGVVETLTPRGQDWSGTARSFYDTGTVTLPVTLSLERSSCNDQ